MTQQNLTDLLERAADRTEVGPPPLDAMVHRVRRRHRQRAVLAGAGLTVVTVVVAVLVPVVATHRDGEPPAVGQPTGSHAPRPGAEISLEGDWLVVGMSGWQGRLSWGHGSHVRVRFHDGRLRAYDGLNTLSGGYVVRGDRFLVNDRLVSTLVGSTGRPYPPLGERLLEARRVARDQGGTYLEDAAGNVLVALYRARH